MWNSGSYKQPSQRQIYGSAVTCGTAKANQASLHFTDYFLSRTAYLRNWHDSAMSLSAVGKEQNTDMKPATDYMYVNGPARKNAANRDGRDGRGVVQIVMEWAREGLTPFSVSMPICRKRRPRCRSRRATKMSRKRNWKKQHKWKLICEIEKFVTITCPTVCLLSKQVMER